MWSHNTLQTSNWHCQRIFRNWICNGKKFMGLCERQSCYYLQVGERLVILQQADPSKITFAFEGKVKASCFKCTYDYHSVSESTHI